LFTGIVEELGTVEALERQSDAVRLTVRAATVLEDTGSGDSISVNGCCLTVAERTEATWTADVMAETLARTGLGVLAAGDRVNLERAVTAGTRLGGHLVQGHVDATGTIVGARAERPLVTPYARRCWMWRRPPDAVVGFGIPAHQGGRP